MSKRLTRVRVPPPQDELHTVHAFHVVQNPGLVLQGSDTLSMKPVHVCRRSRFRIPPPHVRVQTDQKDQGRKTPAKNLASQKNFLYNVKKLISINKNVYI